MDHEGIYYKNECCSFETLLTKMSDYKACNLERMTYKMGTYTHTFAESSMLYERYSLRLRVVAMVTNG